jgi:hypothetical protein
VVSLAGILDSSFSLEMKISSSPNALRGIEFANYVLVLAFLMPNRIYIPQAHRITAVALHLGVF